MTRNSGKFSSKRLRNVATAKPTHTPAEIAATGNSASWRLVIGDFAEQLSPRRVPWLGKLLLSRPTSQVSRVTCRSAATCSPISLKSTSLSQTSGLSVTVATARRTDLRPSQLCCVMQRNVAIALGSEALRQQKLLSVVRLFCNTNTCILREKRNQIRWWCGRSSTRTEESCPVKSRVSSGLSGHRRYGCRSNYLLSSGTD